MNLFRILEQSFKTYYHFPKSEALHQFPSTLRLKSQFLLTIGDKALSNLVPTCFYSPISFHPPFSSCTPATLTQFGSSNMPNSFLFRVFTFSIPVRTLCSWLFLTLVVSVQMLYPSGKPSPSVFLPEVLTSSQLLCDFSIYRRNQNLKFPCLLTYFICSLCPFQPKHNFLRSSVEIWYLALLFSVIS